MTELPPIKELRITVAYYGTFTTGIFNDIKRPPISFSPKRSALEMAKPVKKVGLFFPMFIEDNPHLSNPSIISTTTKYERDVSTAKVWEVLYNHLLRLVF